MRMISAYCVYGYYQTRQPCAAHGSAKLNMPCKQRQFCHGNTNPDTLFPTTYARERHRVLQGTPSAGREGSQGEFALIGFCKSSLYRADHNACDKIFLNKRIDHHHGNNRNHDRAVLDQWAVNVHGIGIRSANDAVFRSIQYNFPQH